MDFLGMMNFKNDDGSFNPSAIVGQLDKIEPMLPMLDELMQSFKPKGSDGTFLMGSIEDTENGPRPVLRLMGFKVKDVPATEEGQAPTKKIEITSNCLNKEGEPLKFDLLALLMAAGNDTPESGGNGLKAVLD